MRAAVYLRISKDPTGEELGVARQREDTRTLIEHRGWTSVAEYADNDRSAAKGKARPEFDALLRACEAGEVDAIVAWSHDRLTRNRRDELRLIETCQDRSIIIALCRGSDIDLTTPAGRMTADILASVARHEIELKSDRSRRANLQRAQAGKPVNGPHPFGYERDGVTVCEPEAEAIRQGYKRILQGGSLRSVARAWNDAGLYSHKPSPKTGEVKPWVGSSVRVVLLNPRHAGLRKYQGEVIGKADWPSVVDEETFRAVEHILTRPERNNAEGRSDRRLLTGVALCDTCGSTVLSGTTTRHAHRMYRCSTRNGAGKHVYRRADVVEEFVKDVVLEYLAQPEITSEVFAPRADEEDTDELVQRANTLRERMDALAIEFTEGTLTRTQLRSGMARLREKLDETERRLVAAADTSPALAELVDADDVRTAWEALDIERQRAVIETVFAEIRLRPPGRGARQFREESVHLRWRR